MIFDSPIWDCSIVRYKELITIIVIVLHTVSYCVLMGKNMSICTISTCENTLLSVGMFTQCKNNVFHKQHILLHCPFAYYIITKYGVKPYKCEFVFVPSGSLHIYN